MRPVLALLLLLSLFFSSVLEAEHWRADLGVKDRKQMKIDDEYNKGFSLDGDDFVVGGLHNNYLELGEGDDVALAYGGHDIFLGGPGSDNIMDTMTGFSQYENFRPDSDLMFDHTGEYISVANLFKEPPYFFAVKKMRSDGDFDMLNVKDTPLGSDGKPDLDHIDDWDTVVCGPEDLVIADCLIDKDGKQRGDQIVVVDTDGNVLAGTVRNDGSYYVGITYCEYLEWKKEYDRQNDEEN